MSSAMMLALDLVAITILAFGIYFPRHRRRDLVVAFLVVNIGVMAVATALGSAQTSAGLGLGLFGVLSIIRLRSSEIDQHEVAYFFAALSMGLLGGITVTPAWLTPALMGVIITAVFIADHPALFGSYRKQNMLLDRAFTDEAQLTQYLETLLAARVHQVSVRKVDLVHDTTSLEVRFQLVSPVEPAGAHEAISQPADDLIGLDR